MEPRLHNEEQIEKTIASIDAISKADAPPFFYTRLQARLAEKTAAPASFQIAGLRPVLSLAVLSLLVVLNITTIRSYLRSARTETGEQQSANGIQSFADTYNLGGSSVFTDKTTDQ
jgi:hypothetical protein